MLISRSERGLMETCCDVTGLWLRTRVRMPEDGRKARERQEAISKTQPKDVSDANAGSVMFSISIRLISKTLRRLRRRPVASGKCRSRTVVQACFGSDLYGVGMSGGPRDLADGFGIEHASLYTISSVRSQSADTHGRDAEPARQTKAGQWRAGIGIGK